MDMNDLRVNSAAARAAHQYSTDATPVERDTLLRRYGYEACAEAEVAPLLRRFDALSQAAMELVKLLERSGLDVDEMRDELEAIREAAKD